MMMEAIPLNKIIEVYSSLETHSTLITVLHIGCIGIFIWENKTCSNLYLTPKMIDREKDREIDK